MNARIVITRGAGNRWYWSLTAHGAECRGDRSEMSLAKAAEAAEASLIQMEANRHYRSADGAA